MLKHCRGFAADDFPRKKERSDGLDSYCKTCNCAATAQRVQRKGPMTPTVASKVRSHGSVPSNPPQRFAGDSPTNLCALRGTGCVCWCPVYAHAQHGDVCGSAVGALMRGGVQATVETKERPPQNV